MYILIYLVGDIKRITCVSTEVLAFQKGKTALRIVAGWYYFSFLFKILAHEKDIWKEKQKGCRGKGGANKVILPRHKTNKVI